MESLIRNKIRADVFTEKLVITTFQKYITHLKQHTVTVLAEALLESSEDIVVIFAKQMYNSRLQQAKVLLTAGGCGGPGGQGRGRGRRRHHLMS